MGLLIKTLQKYCFGTVKWVYSSRRGEQKYRVLWDGDATQMQSGETHLEPEGEVDGPAAAVHEHDDAETPAAEEDDVLVDDAQTDSDTDDVIVPVINQDQAAPVQPRDPPPCCNGGIS
jgi:hypothetical protein